MIKQIEIEKNLAATYLYTNKSVGSIHSERADVLLGQLASSNSDIIKISNFVNKYNSIFPDLDLATKALVAANIADATLLEYGLSTGLNSNKAAPVEEVYSIVHGQIHPNLFIAFGLKLKSE